MAGQVWDQIDQAGRDATAAAADNSITMVSEADQAAFAEIAAKVTANVKAELAAKGVDAEAAYAMVKEEMAK